MGRGAKAACRTTERTTSVQQSGCSGWFRRHQPLFSAPTSLHCIFCWQSRRIWQHWRVCFVFLFCFIVHSRCQGVCFCSLLKFVAQKKKTTFLLYCWRHIFCIGCAKTDTAWNAIPVKHTPPKKRHISMSAKKTQPAGEMRFTSRQLRQLEVRGYDCDGLALWPLCWHWRSRPIVFWDEKREKREEVYN